MTNERSTQKHKILILAAIPRNLRLDEEIKEVRECIERSKNRDVFDVCVRTAVRPQDIRRAIAEESPQIVHFCGHGLEDGSLLLEDDGGNEKPVSLEGLASLFKLHKDYVSCVLLNACHSVKPAKAINEHIKYVIGMNREIQDKSAIAFVQGFYDGLGYEASEDGDLFQRAFDEGLVALQLENPSQDDIPVLEINVDIDRPHKRTNNSSTPRIFQAPPLPTYYVDRPEYAQKLKKILLTNSSDPRTLVVTAIHGLGSIGKSTLATALAHDPEVQKQYCDGILWATLGQQPNLLSLLSSWVKALGDYNFKATSVEETSDHLRTLLCDKVALLVVDDAWNTSDAKVFNVGGARCQVMVTTREGAIAKVLKANMYRLDVMKPDQAMELLTKRLGRNLTDTETSDAQAFAQAVGYLPLALELGAAQVAGGGISWKDLSRDIQQEVARLKTLDDVSARDVNDEADLKKLSLTASLNFSVQQLSDETRSNFIWLGVLPEDVNITPKMAATLWDMDDEQDAADELDYLHSKSLLLSGVLLPDGTPTYRLHDLFHDLACNLLTAPPNPKRKGNLAGLGITLPQAHATFLENYRKKLTKKDLWHTLPNDGYIHQRLVWHLEKAEKIEEIHHLLAEESENGGNGWYEACDRLKLTANFVTDLARAWQTAEDRRQVEVNLSRAVGLQCRYALMTASLNSLATKLPLGLLIALLQKKVWTPEQALVYALQNSSLTDKIDSLKKLADYLPPNLKKQALEKALDAVKQIYYDDSRAEALIALADKLPSELAPDLLDAVKQIQNDRYRAEALEALGDKLPSEFLPDLLNAAKQTQDEYYRAKALIALADKLPSELLPDALDAAKQIQDQTRCAHTLAALGDKLPSELLPEALAAAKQIQDEPSRATVLNVLASRLPELLPEALADAKQIQHQMCRALALSALADKLPPELLTEAFAAVKQIQHELNRAEALSAFADKLPQMQKLELFELWRKKLHILSRDTRPNLLSEIEALAPVIFALGGDEAIKDTASAIQDVSRCWK